MRKLIPFFIILVIVLFAAHFVIYEMLITAWPALATRNDWTLFFVLLIVSSSFVWTSVFIFRTTNKFARLLYNIAAYWTGLFFYLLGATVLWSLAIIFWPQESAMLVPWFCLLAFLVALWGAINAKIMREKHYDVKIANLPEAWKSKKIAMISDLHLGAVNGKRFAERAVGRLARLEPDLVFIVGDFFDGVAADEESLAQIFSNLKPKGGVIAVTGNHDGFTTSTREINALKQAGIRVLENEKLEIDGVQIAGVSYHSVAKQADFQKVLVNLSVDSNKPSILLKHVPVFLDLAERAGFDIVLSGHTHNGQLAPTNLITYLIYKGFSYGLRKHGSMQALISCGLGTWGPPLRVGTNSEIVVMHFQ